MFVSGGVTAFEQKTATTAGDSVSFDAADIKSLRKGTTNVDVTQLAQKDVYQSASVGASTKDAVINQAKDIAGLVVGRKMQLPENMQALFLAYTAQTVKAVEQALLVINELESLVETGFRGLEVERVEDMIKELGRIEQTTDRKQVDLRNILFDLEDSLRATDVMFTYRLIEWTGRVADDAQRVGTRLQLMLAR